MKNFLLLMTSVLVVFISACTHAPIQSDEDKNVNVTVDDETTEEGKICIQVITPAKNDQTGECKEYPTPCDVPAGWTKVESCDGSSNVVGSTKTFDMVVRQFEWEPTVIKVKAGDHVVLNIFNEDVAHGFAIPDLNVNVELPAGQTTKVEFDASQLGSYKFTCSVFCGSGHKQMTGTLIVE